MRHLAIAAAAGLVLLAACDSQTEPSAPPTTQDALTTVTATPTPSPDDVDLTTDAAPTTVEPTTQESEADDGPPELPEEAMEQTQEGAIAFAEHFVDVVNYTGIQPTPGMIADISLEECGTCSNLEATVKYSTENDEVLREDLWEVTSDPDILVFSGADAFVRVPLRQNELSIFDPDGNEVDKTEGATYTMAVDVIWDDAWFVRTVQFE